ncbi:MFS transporter [Streptomyces sp. NPDC006798]|uniref:MFS transporter n=1 Tax=Streptomyces sp. NPDC006798 TaxID=3155462 RepID=UPI0033E59593
MSGRARAMLAVLCGTVFLEGIDVAMLAVAVPAIRADLGLSTGTAAWVVSGYVLGYAGFTLLGGRAADLLGRRRMFLLWLVVFIAFSGLGGFATEGWMLVLSRFVTGVAAAFMTPASLSLITTSYQAGRQRNKALMIYAGTSAGGFSLGLVIGGLLTEIGWRWVFFAPVVLAVLILAGALRLLPADRIPPRTGGFDLPGAVTAAGAMLLLVYGIIRLEHGLAGWGFTLAVVAAGSLLTWLFVRIERRTAVPLVRLGILRNAAMVRADTGMMLLFGAFFGFQFMVTLYLQEERGWTSLQTSLALLVAGIDVILAPTVTPILVNRFGTARVIFASFVVAVVSYALFLPVGADWSYLAMLPALTLAGVAFGLGIGPMTIAATDGVPAEEQGLAGGLLQTAMQFGGAVGISAVTAVYGLMGGDGRMEAFRAGLVVPLVMVIAGTVVAAVGLRAGRPTGHTGAEDGPGGGSAGDPAGDPHRGAVGGTGRGAAAGEPPEGGVPSGGVRVGS